MFDEQARHISYIIDETLARDARTVEPTEQGVEKKIKERLDQWRKQIQAAHEKSQSKRTE